MKKIKGFVLRRLGTEIMIVAESLDLINFDRIVSLNSSAAYLWEELPDTDFDTETAAALLTARYDVEMKTALADARELLDGWKEAGIIED